MSGKERKLSGFEGKKLRLEMQKKTEDVMKNMPKITEMFKYISSTSTSSESQHTTIADDNDNGSLQEQAQVHNVEVVENVEQMSETLTSTTVNIDIAQSFSSKIVTLADPDTVTVDNIEIVTSPSTSVISGIAIDKENLESSEKLTQNNQNIDLDPATWPTENIKEITNFVIKNPIKQDLNAIDFQNSKRAYGFQNRYASKNLFKVELINGKIIRREWLVYSISNNRLFCVPCKLFSKHCSISISFVQGFNDWKNPKLIKDHENSQEHRNNVKVFVCRSTASNKIDQHIHQQYLIEKRYWTEVLKRVIAVVKFLSSRGLAFRGTTEIFGAPDNGNYLGVLELLAEFDPFIRDHIEKYGNPGKGNISYLSSTICDEFIAIVSTKLQSVIVNEITESKYFSISVDSTPDASHTDQLTVIVRYVLEDVTPIERFLAFLENIGHKAAKMETEITNFLEKLTIDLQDCRGQSYDNASNMSGKYSGLQARILERNHLAFYVPCAAHSLNLVGTCAAEFCQNASSFFLFVEKIYNFCSASTSRWQTLQKYLKEKGNLTIKQLSATRWAARADCCKALRDKFSTIQKALQNIIDDTTKANGARAEATGLLKKFSNLEIGIMIILWDDIMDQFNKTSQSLQSTKVNLFTVLDLYESLSKFTRQLRNSFESYEERAKQLTKCNVYKSDASRKQIRKTQSDESRKNETQLDGSSNMRINTFYVIIGNISNELVKRKMAYDTFAKNFGFLTKLTELEPEAIIDHAKYLRDVYSTNLDDTFPEECVHFKYYVEGVSAIENVSDIANMLKLIRNEKVVATFPNVDIALHMFLAIPATNCTGERSFSTLKRVKNFMRSTLGQEKLVQLSLISSNQIC